MARDCTLELALIRSLVPGKPIDDRPLSAFLMWPTVRVDGSLVAAEWKDARWSLNVRNINGTWGLACPVVHSPDFNDIVTTLTDPEFREKHGLPPLECDHD